MKPNRPPLSVEDGFRFIRVLMSIHPDRLGEGVVPEAEVAQRYRNRLPRFKERWAFLEAEVGRRVSVDDAWDAVRLCGAKEGGSQ